MGYGQGMKFVLDDNSGGLPIQHYAEGQITIGQKVYRRSLILLPERVITEWSPRVIDELQAEDLNLVAELAPEIVILGTGRQQRFPHPTLLQPLMRARIGFEAMTTPAACRTYNILMSEGRRVAAALFMI